MGIFTAKPFAMITGISSNTRIFIALSVMACYGLFLYELLPEYLFNFTYSIYYFILPLGAIGGILIVLPKVIMKGSPNSSSQGSEQNNSSYEQTTETILPGGSNQESGFITTNNAGGMNSDIILPSPSMTSNEMTIPVAIQQPVIDEAVLNEMVARAVDPIQRESKKIQEIVMELKNEIINIKSNIAELTFTFETSLTDLKAFQTEIANPLNFMRKYFDSMDIKSLSDPTLPFNNEQSSMHSSSKSNLETSSKKESNSQDEFDNEQSTNDNSINKPTIKHDDSQISRQEFPESLPFKQMFNGSFTLGKLMTTITVLEEILQALDKDSIDILIDQCKSMGLRQEDEHVIYNIINMMDKSGLSVKEILIMLYKFGKVMGISDNEADLVYAKLNMNQGKSHSPLVTVGSEGN